MLTKLTKEEEEFEQWLQSESHISGWTMEQQLDCEFAETGMDREMDFDLEKEQMKRYEIYLEQLN